MRTSSLLCAGALLAALAAPAHSQLSFPGSFSSEAQRRALQPFPPVEDAVLRAQFKVIRQYFDRKAGTYVWDLEPLSTPPPTLPHFVARYEGGPARPAGVIQLADTGQGTIQARLADLPPEATMAYIDRIVVEASLQ